MVSAPSGACRIGHGAHEVVGLGTGWEIQKQDWLLAPVSSRYQDEDEVYVRRHVLRALFDGRLVVL